MINRDNHYKSASYTSTFFLQIKVAPINCPWARMLQFFLKVVRSRKKLYMGNKTKF